MISESLAKVAPKESLKKQLELVAVPFTKQCKSTTDAVRKEMLARAEKYIESEKASKYTQPAIQQQRLRFDKVHTNHFSKLDSIAHHYTVAHNGSASIKYCKIDETVKKRKGDEVQTSPSKRRKGNEGVIAPVIIETTPTSTSRHKRLMRRKLRPITVNRVRNPRLGTK